MNKKVITAKTFIDAICTALLYSIGGPVMAILYCLGIEEEEKMTADNKPSEMVGSTVKVATNVDLFKWPER